LQASRFFTLPTSAGKAVAASWASSGGALPGQEEDMITAKMMVFGAALAGVAGAGGVGAGAMHAHGGFRGHGRDPEMVHKFVEFALNQKLDAIDATPEQRQKVRELSDRLHQQGKALRAGKQDLRDQMLALLAQDEPDATRVRALVHGRIQEFTRFADDATDGLLELHRVLTPEQRAQLLAHARAHHAH
jgi:Spy/CpxP family protein refolding chaperone